MSSPEILTYDGVRAWLAAQAPEAPVGRRGLSCSCPLAFYLRTHGYPTASVDTWEWQPATPCLADAAEGPPAPRGLPDWAHAFVTRIDRGGGGILLYDAPAVTAAEALAVLDQVGPGGRLAWIEAQEVLG